MLKLQPEKANEVIRKLRVWVKKVSFLVANMFYEASINKTQNSTLLPQRQRYSKGTIREIIKELGVTVEKWNRL